MNTCSLLSITSLPFNCTTRVHPNSTQLPFAIGKVIRRGVIDRVGPPGVLIEPIRDQSLHDE